MAYTKTVWEDLPSTNTPITAENLNNMEDGIETNDKKLSGEEVIGNIVVDSIRTKNMFDKNSMVYSNSAYLPGDVNNTQIITYVGTYILIIKLVEGKTYTISKRAGGRFRAGFTNTSTPPLDTNNVITSRLPNNDTGTSMTFTVPTGSPYFVCNYYSSDQAADVNVGYENIVNSIQIEEGSTATTYSDYQNLNSDIIETGSGTNGEYIKFSNGLLVQYGTYSETKSTNVALNHGGYRTSGTYITFPISFNSLKSVSVTSYSDVNNNGFIVNNGQTSVSQIAGFWWTINSNSTALTHSLNYIAIGTWK